jgi:subtilisin family serine protease
VRLYPVNVFGAGAEATTTYDIAVGVYKAVNGGAMIVNMSLGGDGDSSFLHQTIKSAHDQGVVFLGAAGNQPVTTPVYPAAYEEAIAVAAANRDGTLTSYSGRGDWVDLIAPGTGAFSFDGAQFLETGTSYSTAVATGAAAGIAQRTGEFGLKLETQIRGRRIQ